MKRVAAGAAALLALPLLVVVIVLGSINGQGGTAAPAAAAAPVPTCSGTPSTNQGLGACLAAGDGWAGQQVVCLDELWTRESGWSQTAINPQSGAYGIAQALGHVAGIALNREGDNYPAPFTAANPPPWGDSDPAAQISWGLGYIKSTYGTPCGAWAHEEAFGWY